MVGINEVEGAEEEEAGVVAAEEDGRRQMLQSECLRGRCSDEGNKPLTRGSVVSIFMIKSGFVVSKRSRGFCLL